MKKENVFPLGRDWHLKLASKREPASLALRDIAETQIRNLDVQMVQQREERRRRAQERRSRPVDLSERFTVAEVARRLKLADSTIYEWINNGTIEAECHGPTGRIKRISQRALEDYLRKR